MPKYVSLFSGGGGLDLGLEAVGFDACLLTDIDPYSCETLARNKNLAKQLKKPFLRDANIICEDILNLDSTKINKEAGIVDGKLDLLAGGPPCQAFSIFGKRQGRNDPRGQLAFQYLRILKELGPKSFIFENVYGLLTIEGGNVIRELVDRLSDPGNGIKYSVSVLRLNSVDYGVPQFRDRVFIIGSSNGEKISEPEPYCSNGGDLISNLPNWRLVADGLRNLPPMGQGGIANHLGRKHSDRIIRRYASMSFGERDKHTRINKLDPNRPSFAIIVGSDRGGGKGHIHPFEAREVTPRESARMQCFPDWWEFSGKGRHPIRQIGNAVPTLLGAAIGSKVLEKIFLATPPSFTALLEGLDQTHLFNDQELEFPQENGHYVKLNDCYHAIAI